MIKIISFLAAFAMVLVAVLMLSYAQHNAQRKIFDNNSFCAVANICASVNTIKSSMEKGFAAGDHEPQRLSIHSECEAVKLAANFSGYPMTNTAKWFDGLSSYAETDMRDREKNNNYYQKITEAEKLLMDVCGNFQKQYSIRKIDDLFAVQETKEQHKRNLQNNVDNYYLLINQPRAERKKLNALAESLFESNYVPDTFKGDYSLPDSVNYISHNSYAKIYSSGGYLCLMATSARGSEKKHRFKSVDDAAEKHLKDLAPYVDNMTVVVKCESNGIVYYTFCPETAEGIINLDQSIKLAVSSSCYKLLAFDASAFLKNHTNESFERKLSADDTKTKGSFIKNYALITERRLSKDNTQFYCLSFPDSTQKIYTKAEYLRFINN
jgi:hypothetical protein